MMGEQIRGGYSENMPNTDDSSRKAASASSSDESATVLFSHETNVRVDRPVFTQSTFDVTYKFTAESENVKQKLQNLAHKQWPPSCACMKKSLLLFFPFIGIISQYSLRRDLFSDIIAGLTVGIMHIPQGMAYGLLSNLDPVYGLYTSFFPVLVYFFFGTSRHISIGTFAVVCLMVGTAVSEADCDTSLYPSSPSADNMSSTLSYVNTVTGAAPTVSVISSDVSVLNLTQLQHHTTVTESQVAQCRVGVAVAVTFLAGVFQMLMGLLKFGFVTIYLSDPLTRSLTFGASIHVFSSQVKHVFGVKVGQFSGPLKLVYLYIDFFKNIMQTNGVALITAALCMVAMYTVKRWVNPKVQKRLKMPVPTELIVIIVVTLISYLVNFAARFEVKVVGFIPTGVPAPSLPPVSRFSDVVGHAFSTAIVAFAISISMAKLFAKKHNYPLDSDQELLAYGISNFISSFFSCTVSAASLSRSVVQETSGGKTQVTGLVSCALLLVVLIVMGPLFEPLPNCVLAAVIIVNLRGVFRQVLDIRVLYRRAQYFDLLVWIVTAVGVVVTDVGIGLLIGVLFSLLTIVFRTQRPRTSLLGRMPDTDIYEDVKLYPTAYEIPDVKIFRFSSSLYYANASHFVNKLYKLTGCNPELINEERVRCERRQAEAGRQRKNPLCGVLRRRKRLNLTADKDGRTFSDEESVTNVDSSTVETADVKCEPETVVIEPNIHCVVIDCSSMMFIDSVGTTTINQVIKDYRGIGVTVLLACCTEPVLSKLCKAEIFEEHRPVYVHVHDAVLAAIDLNTATRQRRLSVSGGSEVNANLNSDNVNEFQRETVPDHEPSHELMADVNGTLANSSTNAGTECNESKLPNEETNGQVVPSQEPADLKGYPHSTPNADLNSNDIPTSESDRFGSSTC